MTPLPSPPRVIVDPARIFDIHYPVIVVGAGGCGLTAALAARESGLEVLVLEREATAAGTTSMSTGLIPAAGTPEQAAEGISDDAAQFARDIQAKSGGGADPVVVRAVTENSAETIAWLKGRHGVPLTLVSGFTYPGHSVRRMYGSPNRTGTELMAALEQAVVAEGVDIVTSARVTTLVCDGQRQIIGVVSVRPDGEELSVGCDALILASCGYAAAPDLLARFIPGIEEAVFHGHPGAKGDAVRWGEGLGARLGDLDAYQGHGGLAAGHGIPILWPLIMEGGFQINRDGRRFADESRGYSEQAMKIVAQPGNIAWSILDQRLYDMMMQFDDFQQAVVAGAVVRAEDLMALAEVTRTPLEVLTKTFDSIALARLGGEPDAFGRRFPAGQKSLTPPYYAARVNGALFHTQGGLEIDGEARVLRVDGRPFPNLFAGGGAARGISGAGASGYIAGNGLLTATTLGKIAGRAAARQILARQSEAAA